MAYNIRELKPDIDGRAISEIYRHYVSETTVSFEVEPPEAYTMTQRLNGIISEFPGFVWEENGKILGYCYVHRWKERKAYERTLETTIYLSPDYIGRGIGRMLMQKLIDECRRRGFVSLIACITAENVASCRFHEDLGFVKVSHFIKVGYKFGRQLDVVDYQLIL